jgi:hypothetical protein
LKLGPPEYKAVTFDISHKTQKFTAFSVGLPEGDVRYEGMWKVLVAYFRAVFAASKTLADISWNHHLYTECCNESKLNAMLLGLHIYARSLSATGCSFVCLSTTA